ncbi:MAG: zinc ABC transporter solute-binding protein [Kordiimonadaceae bacterium]|jgi:zinc transport system substrate-binding protein|nr:zinc ABC transporter solute-binding protein [Kordiimonadaceae bacterium]MBT6033612.1 zinc ABC transporter solute-binding protein [Kordiimonadaceae bacterium]
MLNLKLRKLIFPIICLFLVSGNGIGNTAPLDVVTSIKPIHSLVSRVMGDLGEPQLLLTGGLTPHIFRMKPSDIKKVINADVLFYVSPKFETFLKSTSLIKRPSLNAIAFAQSEGIKLYPYRTSKIWFTEGDSDDDHEGDMDMHIWLDPANTRRIVNIIEETLSDLDPMNTITYVKNANLLIKQLYEQEELIRELLRPLRDSSMIVYHDAFQYYEKAFSLKSFGAIQLKSDETPSVKHLTALKKIAAEKEVSCVLAIPGTHPRIATAVMGNTAAGYGVVDHLGQYLEPGPESYFQLMFEITQSILDCQEKDEAFMFGAN